MHLQNVIRNFLLGFTPDQLNEIYENYNAGCYDHLLKNPRKPLTHIQEIQGLTEYLVKFIINPDPRDEERPEALLKLVCNKDYIGFIEILDDQFYQEPLFRIVNKMS